MIWIIVANASVARFFSATVTNSQLHLVKEIQHPESRLKGTDLVTDRPGAFKGSGATTGEFVEQTNPKEVEAERFARELANELEEGRVKGRYKALLIYASPSFHGLLNKFLSKETLKLARNVQKDYTKTADNKLPDRVSPELKKTQSQLLLAT